MILIGVDLGTSSIKLLAMREDGGIIKVISRPYPIYYPCPGWAEQDPEDWFQETMNGLEELLDGLDRAQVAAIGIGGQMHGLVVLDKEDRVMRPAILWNDGRTQKETEYLNTMVGVEALHQYTANVAFAGFTAPKLLWMQKNEPELFAQIHKIMLPKDYVNYRLTGEHCTDVSDASGTLMMDVEHRCWSNEMLKICGVERSQMPKIYESYEPVGTLKTEMCDRLGLMHTVTVCAGAGDNAAAAIGTGTIGSGHCNISLGTSGTVFISHGRFSMDPNNALHAFAHADGHYHLMGCMLSAASCNQWWMRDILSTREYAREQAPIPEADLGNNSVMYLPYMMGERSPHNNPNMRGAFMGLSLSTKRHHMTQAVLEGVAFGLRDSIEIARGLGLKVSSSTLCGGGAKSLLWQEILANVLKLELKIPAVEEGPAYGAALLAGTACGVYPSVEVACSETLAISYSVQPKAAIVERYEEQYHRFRQCYPILESLFPATEKK